MNIIKLKLFIKTLFVVHLLILPSNERETWHQSFQFFLDSFSCMVVSSISINCLILKHYLYLYILLLLSPSDRLLIRGSRILIVRIDQDQANIFFRLIGSDPKQMEVFEWEIISLQSEEKLLLVMGLENIGKKIGYKIFRGQSLLDLRKKRFLYLVYPLLVHHLLTWKFALRNLSLRGNADLWIPSDNPVASRNWNRNQYLSLLWPLFHKINQVIRSLPPQSKVFFFLAHPFCSRDNVS
jgi:hypothetical protein